MRKPPLSRETYRAAIDELKKLRQQIGKDEFFRYGYEVQLREYQRLEKAAFYSE